jgi:hypothetical protein
MSVFHVVNYYFPVVMVIYIRYRQIDEYYRSYALTSAVIKHNRIALWTGFISCFGLSLVANFQETNVIAVHLTGAFLCFGLGTVYIWLQVSMCIIIICCVIQALTAGKQIKL